jgi:hypothetical protein
MPRDKFNKIRGLDVSANRLLEKLHSDAGSFYDFGLLRARSIRRLRRKWAYPSAGLPAGNSSP